MNEDIRQERDARLLSLLHYSFGDISQYLDNKDVIEIMLNSNGELFVDTLSKGRYSTGLKIEESDALRIINTVASYCNTIVDKKNPILSAELPERGERFEAILNTNADHPVFTIRKKALLVFTLEDYVEQGNLTEKQKEIIKEAVENKKNILVVGGTSSGKTTFTNAIIKEISKTGDRLVIIEDTEEIQCTAKDYVQLKTSDYATVRDLLKSAMRLRPDRIIIGEIRSGEALDLLTAWNSGHPGGISTIHSETVSGGIKQLEQYIQRVSISKQEELIGMTVNLIVTIKRVGIQRKVTGIYEIKGFENGKYDYKEIR